ncbi:MAG: biotin--[acetyl-CoA-carboxylase] ligase [Lentisphaeria bacterium]|jgi:BirA family biotin operon repressor/biotin-[acetyl-CoA-carboxylase] ligase
MENVATLAPPSSAAVTPLLTTRFLGRQFIYEQELVSTNRSALELAAAGCPAGLIVVAESQTGGRGRMTRSWFSPPGRNLYFSFVLRPRIAPAMVPQLALLAALSLRRALLEQGPTWPLKCKWPNDLWAEGRKISGILCEMNCRGMETSHVVVGIGVNVNISREELPPELRDSAGSLCQLAGRALPRAEILAAILNHFERDYEQWLADGGLASFLAEWRSASVLDDRAVKIEQSGRIYQGVARGITPEGFLRLEQSDGKIVTIHAGDVHVVR